MQDQYCRTQLPQYAYIYPVFLIFSQVIHFLYANSFIWSQHFIVRLPKFIGYKLTRICYEVAFLVSHRYRAI